jgi:opacity protein-like surface antigen
MNLNANFSGEIRVGVGVGDDSVDVLGTEVDVELDKMFGVYLRGGIPVSEVVCPYAIIGYTNGEVTASAAGFGSASESESDVSFGVGVDFAVNKEITINAEYINYFDKDGAEIGGFALGIVTKF